jgi:hypothetical protein
MKGGVALLWRPLDGGRMTFQFHKGLLTYLLKIRTLRHSRIGANDRFLDRCVSLRDRGGGQSSEGMAPNCR